MPSKKIRFINASGVSLAGRLEFPLSIAPKAFAVFAHVFTGSKNIASARHITRALTLNGIAVLRFDFAGLGVSSDSYANEYNKAINDAFQKCSPDVDALASVKTFKAKKYWPQVLGVAATIIGGAMISNDDSKVGGVVLSLSGLIALGINTYDFVVLGEPTHKVNN